MERRKMLQSAAAAAHFASLCLLLLKTKPGHEQKRMSCSICILHTLTHTAIGCCDDKSKMTTTPNGCVCACACVVCLFVSLLHLFPCCFKFMLLLSWRCCVIAVVVCQGNGGHRVLSEGNRRERSWSQIQIAGKYSILVPGQVGLESFQIYKIKRQFEGLH